MGIINNQIIITGELSAENSIQGSLASDETLIGYLNIPTTASIEVYDGEYVVNPSFNEQILDTKHKMMEDDVVVEPIMVSTTINLSGGNTVYIGGVF